MAKFRKLLLMSSIVLLLFVTPGKAVDPTRFKVISKQCYYCMGDNEKGVDNIEACSTENHLEIENCPIQDRFDKCIVFQAFSRSKNTTFFKRECTSERFCTDGTLCSDPDFSSCRFECCTGDLCNDFDFKSDTVSLITTQPTVVEITTKDAAQTAMIPSEATASLKAATTPQTQQQTKQENSFHKTTKPSAERDRTTTEFEHAAGGPPRETSDCVDIDKMCSSYVSNPSHLVYYCEDNKDYMMVYCQRTCNYCNERLHIATTTKQIPTTKKNSEECVDKDPRCRSYVDNAMYLPQFCEDNKSYTSVVCRKTCKFCKGTNTDTNTPNLTTPEVTPTTQKPTSKATSKARPRRTAGPSLNTAKPILKTTEGNKDSFQGDTNTPNPTTPEVTPTTPKPTSKATSKARPRRTAGPSLNTAKPILKTTEGNKDSFQGGIPVGKSSTTPDQTFTSKPTSKNEDCKDRRTSCQMYKTMNFCRIQKWYMEQNCPHTCNFCSKDNSNTTTPKPTSSSLELTSNTPEPTTSTTPEPTESTSPAPTTSTTPEPTTSTTPEPTTSTTPEPTTSTTPEPTESTTPEPTESTTPEPMESTTPEPMESTTPEPTTSTTPEPTTSTTPEPTASTTPEPTASTTPELTSRTPEPTTSTTPELTSRTPEPTAATTPKLTSTTPERTASTTPEPTASTTPEPTASTTPDLRSTTPERTSKASTSQPDQNETTYPTSKSTSTPYQESTTETTSTNEDCMDERPIACAIYAKMSGYCQYAEWFMKKHCPKSCGFCSQENGNGNSGQHGITKRTTLNPPPIPTTKSKESTTEEATESTQLPTTKTTRATGTTSPHINRNSLRWIMMSWGECVNGVQSRVVRCYNFYRGKDYHVTIHACMKLVGEMPAKTRNC